MKEIKFRARTIENSKFNGDNVVYGSLMVYGTGAHKYWICPLRGTRNFPVDPKSIAQFVGLDRDGKEIYEGDVIVDQDGKEFVATLSPLAIRKTDIGEVFDLDVPKFALKEVAGNE